MEVPLPSGTTSTTAWNYLESLDTCDSLPNIEAWTDGSEMMKQKSGLQVLLGVHLD